MKRKWLPILLVATAAFGLGVGASTASANQVVYVLSGGMLNNATVYAQSGSYASRSYNRVQRINLPDTFWVEGYSHPTAPSGSWGYVAWDQIGNVNPYSVTTGANRRPISAGCTNASGGYRTGIYCDTNWGI